VSIVLPRITSGKVSHIDAVLDSIRAQGVQVFCANDLPTPPKLEDAIPRMVYDESSWFAPTLNVDCTILLAIVSDISHKEQILEAEWFNKAIIRQLEVEKKEKLMPSVLWPAMADRDLVCTFEAMKRMREITDLIGTETEKARMRLMLGDSGASPGELRAEFAKLSCHAVPETWRLPIRVEVRVSIDDPRLPPIAQKVADQLSDINQSVFLYGWATQCTTITSNRTAAKATEMAIEENRQNDEEVGPDVWVASTSRSLVAKEKERRGN
jgi:Protein of unknown function (DUF1308)